jgi:putative restriction endonuclease
MKNKLWSREELMLAFNLYLKLPFGKLHSRTPEIINLANLLGRSANSMAIRLNNYASCDPYHQMRGVKGMAGGMRQCQPIWDEFIENKELLIFESERILAEKENETIESKFQDLMFDLSELKGETKIQEIKARVNQNYFRQIVIANYSGKCAVTGIDISELLFASHIIPWAKNEEERLNPENGICLSALYDRAFDRGLIGISESFNVILSDKLKAKKKADFYSAFFSKFENKKITLPQKYQPKKEFIQYHLDEVFNKLN